jgi:energy-coupling factor transporter ATP-binding protein EcfA2
MKTYWLAGHSASGKTTVSRILNGTDLDRFGHWEHEDGTKFKYEPGKTVDSDKWIVPVDKVPIGKHKLLCGTMSNFDEIKNLSWAGRIWLRVSQREQARRLQSPDRDNPFGKDPGELKRAQANFKPLPGDPDSWIIVDADRPLKEVVREVRSIISGSSGGKMSDDQALPKEVISEDDI